MGKIILIIILIVVAVGAGIGGYYYGHSIGYEEGKEVGKAAAQVEAGKAVSGPLESMPSANPYEGAINPFEDAYQNPFK